MLLRTSWTKSTQIQMFQGAHCPLAATQADVSRRRWQEAIQG